MKNLMKSSAIAVLLIFLFISIASAKSTSQHVTFMVTVLPAHHAYLPDHGQQTSDNRLSSTSDVRRANSDLSKWNTEKVTREGKSTLLYTMAD
jgi:hypothetical protein